MAFRRSLTSIAVAGAVAIGAALPTAAQIPLPAAPIYTPAPDAKDLKAVLFQWMWHLGMLRSLAERDFVATLEYQGKGTIQVDGQPCTLTKYRVSTNYQIPGQRTQIACTRPTGQTYSTIEVVSDKYAWNEDIPGAEIVRGQGKATPQPATLHERLIRLWGGTQGGPKAAAAGGAATTLSWASGKPVLTFPIPGVPGATATATLDSSYLAERMVVKRGNDTTEFIYSDHADWNNPLNKAEALYAGRIIERRNGTVVRDLTTVETETGNVYVVVPVPASVKAAAGKATN